MNNNIKKVLLGAIIIASCPVLFSSGGSGGGGGGGGGGAAVEADFQDCFKFLYGSAQIERCLKRNMDPNLKQAGTNVTLLEAVMKDKSQNVQARKKSARLLLEAKANPNSSRGPLQILLANSFIKDHNAAEIIDFLVNAKADLNHRNDEGKTPLIVSVTDKKKGKRSFRGVGIAKCLVNYKADIDRASLFGDTPLMLALRDYNSNDRFSKNQGVVEFLLLHTKEISTVNQNGETALTILQANPNVSALEKSNLTKICESKMAAESNSGTAIDDHRLHNYAQNGNLAGLQAALACRANVNLKNNHNSTALMFAAQEGHSACVNALIAADADVNLKDKDNATAVMHAAAKGHTDVVNALIGAKANLDVQNSKFGSSALIIAAENRHTDIVNALIAADADVNLKDKDNATAVM